MTYIVGFKDSKNQKKFIDFNNLIDALSFISTIKNEVQTYAILEVQNV